MFAKIDLSFAPTPLKFHGDIQVIGSRIRLERREQGIAATLAMEKGLGSKFLLLSKCNLQIQFKPVSFDPFDRKNGRLDRASEPAPFVWS